MISETIGSATAGNNTGGATADWNTVEDWENSIDDSDSFTGTIITQVASSSASSVTLDAVLTGGRTALLTADSTVNFNAATFARAGACARITASSTTVLIISATGFTVEKISVSGSGGNQHMRITATTTLRRLGISAGTFYNIYSSANYTGTNLVFFRGGAGCTTNYHDSGTITIYNSSAYAPASGAGFYNNGTAINCQGVAVQGTGTCYVSCTGNYNLSEDTSAPGANTVESDSGAYTNDTAGSEDYALTSSTTYAIVDRSGYPSDTDTDIVGTSRPSTGADIGVWQNSTSSSSSSSCRSSSSSSSSSSSRSSSSSSSSRSSSSSSSSSRSSSSSSSSSRSSSSSSSSSRSSSSSSSCSSSSSSSSRSSSSSSSSSRSSSSSSSSSRSSSSSSSSSRSSSSSSSSCSSSSSSFSINLSSSSSSSSSSSRSSSSSSSCSSSSSRSSSSSSSSCRSSSSCSSSSSSSSQGILARSGFHLLGVD